LADISFILTLYSRSVCVHAALIRAALLSAHSRLATHKVRLMTALKLIAKLAIRAGQHPSNPIRRDNAMTSH